MKKNLMRILSIITCLIFLTGCTMQIETTDNSVSASVDGDTTEKVDGILDWFGERIRRVFKTDNDTSSSSQNV